jgi:hypothetical protein
VHVYSGASVDAKAVAKEVGRFFPNCKADIRPRFEYDNRIERARISDLKQPFERQPHQADYSVPLYDGFWLQRIFEESIPAQTGHVHIIVTDLLPCTFDEDDWRYHGRALVCGTPSIISTSGIVEAPAKPKEFYLPQFGMADVVSLKKKFSGRFIDHGDDMTAAATAYALQALFFFVADGEPFCKDRNCMLYNAHWQEELIGIIMKGTLCGRHRQMANKFNIKAGRH